VVTGQQVLLLTAGHPLCAGRPGRRAARLHAGKLCQHPHCRFLFDAIPTLAAFVEQYDPGWSALVDGKAAPLLRANLLMRAVPLPAGSHRIELQYRALVCDWQSSCQ